MTERSRKTSVARMAMLAFVLALATLARPALAQAPVASQGPSPSAAAVPSRVSPDELEKLVKTLKNSAARKAFITNLEALIKAQRAQEKVASRPALSDRIADAVALHMEMLSSRMGQVLGVLKLAPHLADWAEGQVVIPAKRDRLIGLIWRFIVIVGLGMVVQYLFRRITNGARRRFEAVPPEESLTGRTVRFLVRTLMLYLNALAYAAGAYGAYVVVPMTGPASAVLLVGATSFFAAKLILATARVFLSPGVPGLRLGDMSDETASYLYIWVRRLVRIFVYAFFLLEAVRIVGLPRPAYESLMYFVGLALVGFLIVFVLQNRSSVARVIRGAGPQSLGGGARARIAGLWHLAAVAYIVAVYLVWLFRVQGGFEFLMTATGWTVLVLVLAKVIVMVADSGLDRALEIGGEMAERYPGIEERANRYMPVFRSVIRWVVYFGTFLIVLDAWGVDTLGWLASPDGLVVIRRAVTIFLIVLIAFIVWEALSLVIAHYLEGLDDGRKGAARARTLLPLMRTTILIVLLVLVVLVVLSELGVDIGPLLAGAGVVGLAIGFGSQKLVQDVITGLFILVEDTLAVGDVVRFDADHAGLVEGLSIRSVKLRDLGGSVHTLPFSEVKTVLNMTKDFAYYLFNVGIAYRENVDHVIEVLKDIGAEMQKDEAFGRYIVASLEILGLDQFGDSAIVIKARIKVQPPIQQWFVGREFNRRMKARFDKEGIEIPFPHRTIYFGEDQQGKAPPARVVMTEAPPGPQSGSRSPSRPKAPPSSDTPDPSGDGA